MGDGPLLILLCGGRQTRAGFLGDLPKFLAPIPTPRGPVPFAHLILAAYARLGIRRVACATGPGDPAIRAALTGPDPFLCINYSYQPEPQGTAAALASPLAILASAATETTVANGDSWCGGLDLAALHRAHRSAGAAMTMACVPNPAATPQRGGLDLAGSRVTAWDPSGRSLQPFVSAGVYAVHPSLSRICVGSLETYVIPRLLAGRALAACPMPGPIVDVGTPAGYAAAPDALAALGLVPGAPP